MSKVTKDRILESALVSFSENGYKGTNLRAFAAGMGLSKSALYRYYESKEAIWNALLDRMESYYREHFGSSERLPVIPGSCEELVPLVMDLVDFTIHDEKIILTRKLLLTEQFHDERVKKLAAEHFMNGTKAMFKSIFEKMTENGSLKREDPDMLAFIFTAPITSLIHCCDREPEKEPEIMDQIKAFIHHFIKMYGCGIGGSCEGKMIETKRLKIYEASEEQMEAFIAEQSAAELKTAYREMLDGCLIHPEQREWYAIRMIELKDGTHIGESCFKGLSAAGSTEIGYGIAEDFRGCGYASEAVAALADWALRQPGVKCITAETEEDNIASQRVLEKAGFVPTGETGGEGLLYIRAGE